MDSAIKYYFMLKKFFIFLTVLGVLALAFYNFFIKGWYEFRRATATPEEYLNHTAVSPNSYSNDSIQLMTKLKGLLSNKVGFFNNSSFSDSTILIIDTIVYSSMHNRLVFILISKNPTAKQMLPNNDDFKWYYDGTSYIGIKKNGDFLLQEIGSIFTNSHDFSDLSKLIRMNRFDRFITKDKKDDYEYNLNDVRFWNNSIWRKLDSLSRK